jgi:hypothetical protein
MPKAHATVWRVWAPFSSRAPQPLRAGTRTPWMYRCRTDPPLELSMSVTFHPR